MRGIVEFDASWNVDVVYKRETSERVTVNWLLVTWLIYLALALFGSTIGSCLSVVIHRLSVGASVVSRVSACPTCEVEIHSYDKAPILSWILLRGKCRYCKEPISDRYPLIEALNALLWIGCYAYFGWSVELIAFLYLTSAGLVLTMIDLAVHRLPNVIVLPSYLVLGGIYVVGAIIDGPWGGDWSQLLRAALAGLSLYVFYFLIVLIYPRGMGFGDVKLAGVLGAALGWFGWGHLLVGSFAAFLLGGVLSIGLLLTGKAKRGTGIPFGPWMILGAGVGVLWGEQIFDSYLQLVGF